MSFSSDNIDRAQVERFKNSIRPTLQFPMGKPEVFALAEALEELAAEFRQSALKMKP